MATSILTIPFLGDGEMATSIPSILFPQTELALGVLAWFYRIRPCVLAFGSVLVVSRCVPLFLPKNFPRCARPSFSNCITGRRGGRAKRGPRGAFLYPLQTSSFYIGFDAGIIFVLLEPAICIFSVPVETAKLYFDAKDPG